ncbi:V-type ATP synthase subunit I [Anaerolentibacter hominis]|uniref:V-type ATP synthase subunit I n=1 Tax=Anaerolentibacter hominis TaxID=3079009 RepID=UPI0031B7F300
MAIEKMTLIQMTGDISCLDEVLVRCSRNGHFHPELPPASETRGGFQQMNEENPYRARLNRVVDIAVNAGIELHYEAGAGRQIAQDAIDHFVEVFQKKLAAMIERRRELETLIEQNQTALVQLKHLDTLDVSLDELFACEYLKVRFGRLPIDSYKKLEYYKDRLFFFLSLSEGNTYHWGVYLTTPEHEAEVDDIFSSLYFERIFIPDYVHGTPGAAKKKIEEDLAADTAELKKIQTEITALVQDKQEEFLGVYSYLRFLDETFELRKYAMAYKHQFHLMGFLPKREEKQFSKSLEDIEGITVEFKPEDSDKRLKIPTKLHNCRLFAPFEMFVDMYGTPSYNEIDPTPFVAITYMLLFGIMFGDLGQGIAIAVIGALLWKFKKMNLGRIMERIGVTSALFGLLYGSVFGMEHVLDPLYTKVLGLPGKPVEIMEPATINQLLILAVALGVVLILVSMLVNVVIGLKNKDFEQAFFSNNGVAGMVFYIAILAGLVLKLTGGPNLFTLPYILCFIVLPILIIFLKGPLGQMTRGRRKVKLEEGVGSFILEGFFELFEVVLSFITNTMSFLRVGGFIISHAGMMAVVLTLTEMMNGAGSIAALVIGNLFVMCLEGFIVGIQSLRLEFYEMFSRYFDGQGSEFNPITSSVVDAAAGQNA